MTLEHIIALVSGFLIGYIVLFLLNKVNKLSTLIELQKKQIQVLHNHCDINPTYKLYDFVFTNTFTGGDMSDEVLIVDIKREEDFSYSYTVVNRLISGTEYKVKESELTKKEPYRRHSYFTDEDRKLMANKQ